jgi:hypothetical protein
MAWIPGGTFRMGSDAFYPEERPVHRVAVDGFWMDRHPAIPPLEGLYATGDVALYDLESDPGELENLAHPGHPRHDPVAVERMLAKLHALIEHELGQERPPFDLDLFGTRVVKYRGGA